MKRCLVTGGAGFVGRHMIKELQTRTGEYREIISVDLDPMEVDLDFRKVAHVHIVQDAIDFLRSDGHQYDLVVHCAYAVGGRAGIDGINPNLARNLELDAALFHWAWRVGPGRILYFSSSAVYPVKLQEPNRWGSGELMAASETGMIPGRIRDYIPLEERYVTITAPDYLPIDMPDADYGYAKWTGERLAARARAMGVNVHVVRPFSGYGEDQDTAYPFPAIVLRARRGDLTVWGPKGQLRDWIHIDDVVKGALAVVDADCQQPVNLCTGVPTEMGDLARMIDRAHQRHLGSSYPYRVHYQEDKPTGVFSRVGDPTRMLQYYTPQITLEEGIRRALTS